MKKRLLLVLMVVVMVLAATGCSATIESVADYQKRIEDTLTKSKDGFEQAIADGDYARAIEIRDRYAQTFVELRDEIKEQVANVSDDPEQMAMLRDKCSILERIVVKDISEMTETVLGTVQNVYGADSNEYKALQKEYEAIIKSLK